MDQHIGPARRGDQGREAAQLAAVAGVLELAQGLGLDLADAFAVADSLAFTIDQMAAIDAAYRAAFPARG